MPWAMDSISYKTTVTSWIVLIVARLRKLIGLKCTYALSSGGGLGSGFEVGGLGCGQIESELALGLVCAERGGWVCWGLDGSAAEAPS
jgi:hypothetical protein